MKKWIYGLLVILLAVLLIYVWPQPKTERPKTVINQTGQTLTPKESEKAAPKVDHKDADQNADAQWFEAVDAAAQEVSDRDFMTVYTDWKWAQRCALYYRHEQKMKQAFVPSDWAKLSYPVLARDSYQPSALQQQALADFLQTCDALKRAVFQRENIETRYPKYQGDYPVVKALAKELAGTIADTAEAQSLKQALTLIQEWQAIMDVLLEDSMGQLVLSEAERKETMQEMMGMVEDMQQMTQDPENVDLDDVTDAVSQLQEQQAALSERTGPDAEARQESLARFAQVEVLLRQKLRQTEFIETFKELMLALEFSETFDLRVNSEISKAQFQNVTQFIPEYIAPSHELLELSGIGDKRYFDVIIKPAAHLYYCERGGDCGPESELVMNYCLGQPFQGIDAKACGLSLPEFYRDHYLTPNQRKAVHAVKQMMEGYYAQ